jgi:hypothetical protein
MSEIVKYYNEFLTNLNKSIKAWKNSNNDVTDKDIAAFVNDIRKKKNIDKINCSKNIKKLIKIKSFFSVSSNNIISASDYKLHKVSIFEQDNEINQVFLIASTLMNCKLYKIYDDPDFDINNNCLQYWTLYVILAELYLSDDINIKKLLDKKNYNLDINQAIQMAKYSNINYNNNNNNNSNNRKSTGVSTSKSETKKKTANSNRYNKFGGAENGTKVNKNIQNSKAKNNNNKGSSSTVPNNVEENRDVSSSDSSSSSSSSSSDSDYNRRRNKQRNKQKSKQTKKEERNKREEHKNQGKWKGKGKNGNGNGKGKGNSNNLNNYNNLVNLLNKHIITYQNKKISELDFLNIKLQQYNKNRNDGIEFDKDDNIIVDNISKYNIKYTNVDLKKINPKLLYDEKNEKQFIEIEDEFIGEELDEYTTEIDGCIYELYNNPDFTENKNELVNKFGAVFEYNDIDLENKSLSSSDLRKLLSSNSNYNSNSLFEISGRKYEIYKYQSRKNKGNYIFLPLNADKIWKLKDTCIDNKKQVLNRLHKLMTKGYNVLFLNNMYNLDNTDFNKIIKKIITIMIQFYTKIEKILGRVILKLNDISPPSNRNSNTNNTNAKNNNNTVTKNTVTKNTMTKNTNVKEKSRIIKRTKLKLIKRNNSINNRRNERNERPKPVDNRRNERNERPKPVDNRRNERNERPKPYASSKYKGSKPYVSSEYKGSKSPLGPKGNKPYVSSEYKGSKPYVSSEYKGSKSPLGPKGSKPYVSSEYKGHKDKDKSKSKYIGTKPYESV